MSSVRAGDEEPIIVHVLDMNAGRDNNGSVVQAMTVALLFNYYNNCKGKQMAKVRNDFRVYTYHSTARPDIEQWQVKTGGEDVCFTSRTLAEAERVAAALNIDPYYLERGNTQKDRANMQAPINENTYK